VSAIQSSRVILHGSCGNGRTPRIPAAINRAQRCIDKTAKHWAGTQQEFNAWALDVMAGALRGMANNLWLED